MHLAQFENSRVAASSDKERYCTCLYTVLSTCQERGLRGIEAQCQDLQLIALIEKKGNGPPAKTTKLNQNRYLLARSLFFSPQRSRLHPPASLPRPLGPWIERSRFRVEVKLVRKKWDEIDEILGMASNLWPPTQKRKRWPPT